MVAFTIAPKPLSPKLCWSTTSQPFIVASSMFTGTVRLNGEAGVAPSHAGNHSVLSIHARLIGAIGQNPAVERAGIGAAGCRACFGCQRSQRRVR